MAARSPRVQSRQSNLLSEVELLGLAAEFDPQYDLTQLSADRRVQVRDMFADREDVLDYAQQMKDGAIFPPILVTLDAWTVDGNTRTDGALHNGMKRFPAWVLNIAWESATEKEKSQLVLLGATLNDMGGRRLSAPEKVRHARNAIALGWKNEHIGKRWGFKPADVTRIRQQVESEQRLANIGLSADDLKLKAPARRALGKPTPQALNDAPFRDLAKLTADAGLTMREVADLATEVKAVGNEQGQVRRLDTFRKELMPRIRERELTGSQLSPVPARMLRQHLGFILKYAGKEFNLVEADPTYADMHYEQISNAIAILDQALTLQSAAK